MARMTKDERAQLDALKEKADAEEAADASTEVWVKNAAGHEVKLTGSKARKFLSQFGLEDEEGEEQEEGEEGEEADPEPAGAGGYGFGRRSKK